MVLSMVAMGVAGFAGSAAAQTTDSNIADGSVIADGADTGETARHIFRIDIAEGDLGDGDLENITINYSADSGIDLAQLDEVPDSATDGTGGGVGDGLDNNNDISIFIDGNPVSDATTNVTLGTSDSNTTLTIGSGEGAGSSLSGVTNADSLATGTTVTIVLDSDGSTLTNPGSSTTVDVTIGESGSSTNAGTVEGMELALGSDAPIQVDDDGSNIVSNDTVLDSAISDGDSAGASTSYNVTIDGTVDNTDPTGTGLFSTTQTVSDDGSVIEGTSNAEVLYDGNVGTEIINLGDDVDNVEIKGIQFHGADDDVGVIGQEAGGSLGAYNLTVEENTFTNFTANTQPVLDLAVDDGGSPVTLDVNNNDFSNITANTNDVVSVDTSNAADGNTEVVFDTNTFDFTPQNAGDAAINFADTTGIGTVSVAPDEIQGNGDGTGIDVEATAEADFAITDGLINDTDTGISAADAGDHFNVSGTSIDYAGSNAISLTDLGADVLVNNSASIDQSGTGILIDDLASADTITVDNVEINGSSNAAIDLDSTNDVNNGSVVRVTGSTLSNNAGGFNVTATRAGNPGQNLEADLGLHFNCRVE
jgi:hypothetical protein